MLAAYDVDLYLCGHDHTLQHLSQSTNTTQYFVSGNGAWRGTITPIPEQKFGVVDPGFMLHSVRGKTEMSTVVVDLNGKTIYSYDQKRIAKRWEKKAVAATGSAAQIAME